MASPSQPVSDDRVSQLGRAIIRVTRELAASLPVPRGAPFFGLDLPTCDPTALDAFCGQGIFRKYQRAIALQAGLGGSARWWAIRFGCRVVGIDARPQVAAQAVELSRRAALDTVTCFAAGCTEHIPVGGMRFTHAWGLWRSGTRRDLAGLLKEAFRVLRPAGWVGLHLVAAEDETVDPALWRAQLAEAGFIAPDVRAVPAQEPPEVFLTARRRLHAFLNEDAPSGLAGEMIEDLACAPERIFQLFAQRPS